MSAPLPGYQSSSSKAFVPLGYAGLLDVGRAGPISLDAESSAPVSWPLRWSPRVGIELSKWPNIEAYLDRVAARPKVKEAMKVEGLLK